MQTFEQLYTRYKTAGGVAECEYRDGMVQMTYTIHTYTEPSGEEMIVPCGLFVFSDIVDKIEKR
jgi:hypothetical protein